MLFLLDKKKKKHSLDVSSAAYPRKSFNINLPQIREKSHVLMCGLGHVANVDLDTAITKEESLQGRKETHCLQERQRSEQL